MLLNPYRPVDGTGPGQVPGLTMYDWPDDYYNYGTPWYRCCPPRDDNLSPKSSTHDLASGREQCEYVCERANLPERPITDWPNGCNVISYDRMEGTYRGCMLGYYSGSSMEAFSAAIGTASRCVPGSNSDGVNWFSFWTSLPSDTSPPPAVSPPPAASPPPFLSLYAGYAQIGEEMRGYALVDFAGAAVALSRDGTTLVFGAPEDSEFFSYGLYRTYSDAGYVEVHRLDSTSSPPSWVMIGNRLDGETDHNRYGRSVAVNEDGSRIVIGRPVYYERSEDNPATVTVYEWDASLGGGTGDWSQVGDAMPTTYDGNVGCGNSVATSDDGSVVAMGCLSHPWWRESLHTGHVEVYEWNTLTDQWTQRGPPLSVDEGGHIVALSGDGRILAIGAPLSIPRGTRTGSVYSDPDHFTGSTRVYEWDATLNGGLGDWVQRGDRLADDPMIYGAQFGSSVSLSVDGSVLAIGAPTDTHGARPASGVVSVFSWDGNGWVTMGDAIAGPESDSHIGESVSLNDAGDVLAVSAHAFGNGAVRMYAWDNVAGGGWVQVGDGPIDAGPEGRIEVYASVALNGDGTRLAIGEWPMGDSGNFDISDGRVRVYDAHPPYPPGTALLPPPPSPPVVVSSPPPSPSPSPPPPPPPGVVSSPPPPPDPLYTLVMCKDECKTPYGQLGSALADDYYYDNFQSYGGNEGGAGSCEDASHAVDCNEARYQHTDIDSRPTLQGEFDDLRQCMYWCQCCAFPAED